MNYGHSKDKRNDKKQIKIGNGIVVDAKVLSGNTKDNEITLEPGKIKMSKQSLRSIMGIFEYVPMGASNETDKTHIKEYSSINSCF
mgnify:CR=1 FL=1